MKAMILAAGLGTRLRPYSQLTPKALFSINERPVLATVIEKLQQAGCDAVIINSHHHHRQIQSFLSHHDFGLPVHIRHEVDILGTGGGIRNVSDFWTDGPLLVINADIVSDIDLAQVHAFHLKHKYPVTMVMHDHAQFNSVGMDGEGFITGFGTTSDASDHRTMAFTGIHVLDRRVLDFLPPTGPAHIIDAYRAMISAGERIKAWEVRDHSWYDIGTPANYMAAVYDHMAPLAFKAAFGRGPRGSLEKQPLQGDGSDRRWYRLTDGRHCLIMVDHGIRTQAETLEVEAFVSIGQHLADAGIAVPRIHAYDRHAGLVFLEDLGATHLQTLALAEDAPQIVARYHGVIDQWITMAIEGAQGFNTRWCHQTPYYDQKVVLNNECRYFVEAFVQGYLQWDIDPAILQPEFEQLAQGIMAAEVRGFIHRDFQSRNIMVQNNQIHIIDFQGGRIGPIQYDLASLLIDPYAQLSAGLQADLLAYAVDKLRQFPEIDADRFRQGYALCALSRNLQILGAYAFLSRVKNKTDFEQYIPRAARSLVRNLACLQSPGLPKLGELAERIVHTTRA